ncbi:MAG TPA: hypothetical protein PLX35_16975 [Cyclobacteriaceae bacterium]|nr:hypothetical protein [Cyclobacteriaceae bacterium]
MRNIFYATTLALFVLACTNNRRDHLANLVIDQTIDSVLSFATQGITGTAILIHSEYYPNELKTGTVVSVFESKEFIIETERKVIEDLIKLTYDSVKFQFSVYKRALNGDTIVIFEEGSAQSEFYLDPNYRGSINITDASYNEKFGCYYFAYNCGNGCSRGYFVSVRKNDELWVIDRIIPVWRG